MVFSLFGGGGPSEIALLQEHIDKRFDEVNAKLDGLSQQIGDLAASMQANFDNVVGHLENIAGKIDDLRVQIPQMLIGHDLRSISVSTQAASHTVNKRMNYFSKILDEQLVQHALELKTGLVKLETFARAQVHVVTKKDITHHYSIVAQAIQTYTVYSMLTGLLHHENSKLLIHDLSFGEEKMRSITNIIQSKFRFYWLKDMQIYPLFSGPYEPVKLSVYSMHGSTRQCQHDSFTFGNDGYLYLRRYLPPLSSGCNPWNTFSIEGPFNGIYSMDCERKLGHWWTLASDITPSVTRFTAHGKPFILQYRCGVIEEMPSDYWDTRFYNSSIAAN